MAKHVGFATKAVDAGANNVRSIEFVRHLKNEALVLALRAAKDKAEAMAHEYSARLGKVVIMRTLLSKVDS